MSINLEKICRVCMQECIDMIDIFEKQTENLASKLFFLTSIKIYSEENLPHSICKQCSENLDIAYKFKKQYEHSDKFLRCYISNSTNFESITIKEERIDEEFEDFEMTRFPSDYEIPTDQIKQETNDLEDSFELKINGNDANSDIFEEKQPLDEIKQENDEILEEIENQDFINNLEENKNGLEISNVITLTEKEYSREVLDANNIISRALENNEIAKCISPSSLDCDSYDEEVILNGHSSYNNLYLCDLCDLVLQSKDELLLHKATHPGVQLLQCNLCDKLFIDEDKLRKHILIHTGERKFICKICKTIFTDKNNLLNHMHLHSNFRPYKCQICLKTFSKIELYTNHFMKHKGPRRFCCHFCNRTFLQKQALDVHLKSHSNPNIKPYQCSNCNKAFRLRTQLRRHVIINSKCNQFSCDICKKRFPTENFLKNHIRTHKNFK